MKVVCPFFSGDLWLLLKNLEWIADLDGHLDYSAVLACDNQTDYSEVMEMAQAIFCEVELLTYNRAKYNGRDMDQWPWPQNNAFAKTAQHMALQKEPWLWLETDAVPLQPGWVQLLEAEYNKGQKPFGGHVNGGGIFNGVAIYPAHVAKYSVKALTATLTMNTNGYRQPPWDVFCSKEIEGKVHNMNHLMQHVWDVGGRCPTFPDTSSLNVIRDGVVLFHRNKDGTLIDRMRQKLNKPALTAYAKRIYIHLCEQHANSGTARVRENWHSFYRTNNVIPFYYREPYQRVGFERNLPYLKDVLAQGLRVTDDGHTVFILTNDDTLFHPDLPEVMERHLRILPFGCSFRLDINPGEPFPQPPRPLPNPNNTGHDLFFFQADFLKSVLKTIPDFILGTWKWDLIMSCLMRQWAKLPVDNTSVHSNTSVELPFGYVLHERHKAFWSLPQNLHTLPSQVYNQKLYTDWLNVYAPRLLKSQP